MENGKNAGGRRRLIERLILVVAVLVTAGLALSAIHFEGVLIKQRTMYYQLQILRTAVNLFKAVNKRNPNTLEELATTEYQFPDENLRRRFLDTPVLEPTGQMPDPFSRPYKYDVKTGWVASTSAGYEYW